MFQTLVSNAIHFMVNFISFLIFSVVTTTGYSAVQPVPTREVIIQTSPAAPSATATPNFLHPTSTPAPSVFLYTVQAGDTLEKIAKEHNLTSLQLASYNQLNDPNNLQVGQIIKISNNPEDYGDISPYYQEEIYQAKDGEKHILVILSEQRLYTYEGDQLISSYLISSGTASYPTVTGVFKVWIKLPVTTMSGGTGSDAYYLPDVKNTMYFYGDYGIHGTYWHNNFGTPMSHGCINMSDADAEVVYNWANIGTVVQVVP